MRSYIKKFTWTPKVLCVIIYIFFLLQKEGTSQVGINMENSTPDPSAMVDIQSLSKGFLAPRMTEAQREAIPSPAEGLMIYQLDGVSGFYYNEGSKVTPLWKRVGGEESNNMVIDSRIPLDSVAVFGDYFGTPTLYAITEPGSYYLTQNITLAESGLPNSGRRGIIIDSDNVTIDLNGYSLIGDNTDPPSNPNYPVPNGNGSDAIDLVGTHSNITVKNGQISNWQGDGIELFSGNNCLIQDIQVTYVTGVGIIVDNHCIVENCVAYYCGSDGFRGDEAVSFINCRAHYNDGEGIDSDFGGRYFNCTANFNQKEGFSANEGSLFYGCVANENLEEGFKVRSGTAIIECSASYNESDGINALAYCLISGCYTTINGGNGINMTSTGGRVMNNQVINNDLAGIHCTTAATHTLVQNNSVVDNDDIGIFIEANGCFIIGNRGSGNEEDPSNNNGATYDPHFQIASGSDYGPIINVFEIGDISTVTGSDNPYANFIY